MLVKEGYTYDDVLLVPKLSPIESRGAVDTSTEVCGLKLAVPIISANMDTCTEYAMASAMDEAGGLGIIHRFMPLSDQLLIVERLKTEGKKTGVSIGVNAEGERALMHFADIETAIYRPDIITIDIAHGHSVTVLRMIEKFKQLTKGMQKPPKLMAGNVATVAGARDLVNAGADAVKVGVGGGSLCTTRIVTGCGVPQLTAIFDAVDAIRGKLMNDSVSIIADGGIKYSGDITKALAAGADAVMIGGLFAGAIETPGQVITMSGKQYKVYRGMASKDAQVDRVSGNIDANKIVAEGEGKLAPINGSVKDIVYQLNGGLRSGMSYCGARTLSELRDNAEFIKMSTNGYRESLPHGIS